MNGHFLRFLEVSFYQIYNRSRNSTFSHSVSENLICDEVSVLF